MTNVAWKNLAGDRARFAISVAGVAFAVLLILILRGLYHGIIDEATRYVRTSGADVWVGQAGTPGDFLQSMSVLSPDKETDIEAVPGVAEAAPLLSRSVAFRLGGRDADLFMIGVDTASRLGWPLADGRLPTVPRRGEILIDRVFAENLDIQAGDVLRTGAARVRVREVVSGGNAVAYQFGWGNLPDVDRLTGSPGFVSYFLVRTDGPGARDVARRIESRVPGTKVFTTTELADRNAENLREGFLPMLWVLVLVAFVVGTAMIGLIIYTATVERRREYGVLKAIGFSNRRLYKVVYQQSLIATAAGYLVGCVLSFLVADAVERVVPVFVTSINPGDLVFAASGAFLMSIVASFIPARPVARLDPAEVFRA